MSGDYSFNTVPRAEIPRSAFRRDHTYKTMFDAGYLVPVLADEVLPGDTFNLGVQFFARLQPLVAPVFDNAYLDYFFFFVPNRLLWDNWAKMMGEQANPGDSIDYLVPVIDPANHAIGSLYDYLGLPTGIANTVHTNLHGRAYNLIWNEWFRDENLQTRAVVDKDNGPDSAADYVLKKRGKRHDYFTSCLPWPQKGTAAVVPLGAAAPVVPTGDGAPVFAGFDGPDTIQAIGAEPWMMKGQSNGAGLPVVWSNPKLEADLSTATAATINQLREAFQIQRLLERDARGGTRYVELLKSHFGVVSPDFRLQRPEFLGGGSVMVNVNPVAQTSATAAEPTPAGWLAAFATASGSGGFNKSFTEHGVILGLVCVRCELSYQQGMHKMFSRRTRYDHYFPAFAHLGEQSVLNKEIYYQGNAGAGDDLVFGYQERWAEYRYMPSRITGKLRSTAAGTLEVWHYAQKFTALPTLNAAFIEETPPLSRAAAIQDEPQIALDVSFFGKVVRPMPTYSVPGLLDHF